MVDTGKVLKNVYKKKLAEYVRQKEEKGEQPAFSETATQSKAEIKTPQRRQPLDLEFNFLTYQRGAQTPTPSAQPITIRANLSNAEKKKLENTLKSINASIELGSAQAIIDRINALMKRLIPESANYSVEYTEVLLKIIKELNKKVEILVPANQRKEAKTIVKNAFNQVEELLEERLAELKPEEESGIPAVEVSEVVDGKKVIAPTKIEKKKVEVLQPIPPEADKYTEIPKVNFPNPFSTVASRDAFNAQKTIAKNKFTTIFPLLANKQEQDLYLQNYVDYIKDMVRGQQGTIKDITDRFIELSDSKIPPQPAVLPAGNIPPAKNKKGGMRKGKYNTARGFIGYGDLIPSQAKRGFATAPMNANSPFHQQAFRSPQSDAIAKYLNFNVVPNEKGNFAVIED